MRNIRKSYYALVSGRILRSPTRFQANSPSASTPSAQRCGYTLIEMLALLAITGTLMSLTAMVLQRSMKIHNSAVAAVVSQKRMNDLRMRLKDDFARSRHLKVEGELALETFQGDSIKYSWNDGVMTREFISADERSSACDSWPMAIESVECSLEEDGAVPLAMIGIRVFPHNAPEQAHSFLWIFRLGTEADR